MTIQVGIHDFVSMVIAMSAIIKWTNKYAVIDVVNKWNYTLCAEAKWPNIKHTWRGDWFCCDEIDNICKTHDL